jgi:tetratricopeptide (TPR) repeat protein
MRKRTEVCYNVSGKMKKFRWSPSTRRRFSWPGLLFLAGLLAPAGLSQSLETLLTQATGKVQQQEFEQAEKLLQQGLTTYGDHPDILKVLGTVYQSQGRYQESIDVFLRILKRAPVYPEVNLFLGVSYYSTNQFEKAVEALNNELQGNPKDFESRYYLGLALDALGRKVEAVLQLENLLQDNPQDAKALYQLTRFYKTSTHRTFQRLVKAAPDSDFVIALRAELDAENGKLVEAMKQYRRVLAKNADFPGIHFAIGQIHWQQAQYTEAMIELKLALDEDPNHPLGNYYAGDILAKDLRYEEAIGHLRQAVAADDKLMQAHFLLGKSYITTGKLEEALDHLLKAEKLAPESTPTHYQLSQVYARLNNREKSQRHLEIFQKLTQENKDQIEKRLQSSSAVEPSADRTSNK